MIAITTPFSGKEWCLDSWLDSFYKQDFDKKQMYVVWCDNSRNDSFHAMLEEFKNKHQVEYRGFLLVKDDTIYGDSKREVVSGMYLAIRNILQSTKEEFSCILTYEDDVIPPVGGLASLHLFLYNNPTISLVGGLVPYKESSGEVYNLVWNFSLDSTKENIIPIPKRINSIYAGINPVDAVSLGFCLSRPTIFYNVSLNPSAINLSVDQLFCWEAKELGSEIYYDGTVRCNHLKKNKDGIIENLKSRTSEYKFSLDLSDSIELTTDIIITTPFSGKTHALDDYLKCLDNLEWDKKRLHLVLLDNSNSDLFYNRLKEELGKREREYRSIVLGRETQVSNIKHRHVPYLYNRLRALFPDGIPYVFCWEDDVLIPPSTLRDLYKQLYASLDVGAVSGIVPYYRAGGDTLELLVWQYEVEKPSIYNSIDKIEINVKEADQKWFGTSTIDGCGFGCLLTRRSLFDTASLEAERFRVYHDQVYGWELSQLGFKTLAVWHTMCQHIQLNKDNKYEKIEVPHPKIDRQIDGNGKYILLVDEEDKLGKNYVNDAITILEEDDNVAFVYPVLISDRQLEIPKSFEDSFKSLDISYPTLKYPGMVVRREALGSIGYKTEELPYEFYKDGWESRPINHSYLLEEEAPEHKLTEKTLYMKYQKYNDEVTKRRSSPVSVLFQNRNRTWEGGDVVVMDNFQQGLRKEGLIADSRGEDFGSIDNWDIVHILHLAFPWSRKIAERCIEKEKPYVVSAILHDIPSLQEMDFVARHSMAIIASTEGEREEILKKLPALAQKTIVIPYGVDPRLFYPSASYDLGEPFIFVAGRYEPRKNIENILLAAKHINAPIVFCGGPDCQGSWGYYNKVKELAYDKATFLQRVSVQEYIKYIKSAHVVCQASTYESFGLVAYDAQAAGTNIVVSNTTLAKDYFSPFSSICDPTSITSIAAALSTELGRRKIIKPRPPTWKESARSLIPIYLGVLDQE